MKNVTPRFVPFEQNNDNETKKMCHLNKRMTMRQKIFGQIYFTVKKSLNFKTKKS